MQVRPPNRGAGVRVLHSAAGLVLLALNGIALSAPLCESFATPFRPEFHFPARVTCPAAEVLPRPLVSAAACGDLMRVRARLEEGADVEARDPRTFLLGRSALHHAVQRGDQEVLQALLAAGADANAVDAFGNTPLHLLSMRARSEAEIGIARLLLEAGADGRLRNGRGRTALAELLSCSVHTVDPLRISAAPLAILLDEAEAKGPTGKGAIQRAGGAESSGALRPAVAETVTTVTNGNSTASANIVQSSVRSAIEQWAAAWSARDVDAYLSHYRADFKPADGLSLDDWRAQRRKRIGSASAIAVKVSDIRIRVEGDRAVAQFRQDYRSDALKSVDVKTLVLVSEGQGWRIAEEKASR